MTERVRAGRWSALPEFQGDEGRLSRLRQHCTAAVAPRACPLRALLCLCLSLLQACARHAKGANFTCARTDTTCTALGSFYSGSLNSSWRNSSGWSAAAAGNATDYCTFAGCGCQNLSLTSLDLSDFSIVGVLPPPIGQLSTLTSLCVGCA